jgi:hypothetical protein
LQPKKKAKKLRTAYFAGKLKSFKSGSTNERCRCQHNQVAIKASETRAGIMTPS